MCVYTDFFANSAFPQIQESTVNLSQMWLCVGVCTHASDADTLV